MLIKRRDFLQVGSMLTASFMVPKFLKAFSAVPRVASGNKVLVVLQLSGGNDGLNTVIPVRNDIYYRSRPGLGIDKTSALSITDDVSLHPALEGFKDLYLDGSLSILNGVGYPNPDRSHFRSMDIWQTASSSNEFLNSGWIGRYLDAQCSSCAIPTQAMELDDMLSFALKGERIKGIAFKDPGRLYESCHDQYFKDLLDSHSGTQADEPASYLYKIMAESLSSADYIYNQSKLRPSVSTYPQTELGKNLKTIASLIFSDINTQIYYVSLGSFDTHVNQQAQQQRLFSELNDAMKAFVADLKSNHRFDDVLVMTFSEFGRRVSQNASGGTDHGTANNMFLIGGGLKEKGLINSLPDLSQLYDGDLQFQVDFRNVYGTVIRNWLQCDDEKILRKPGAYLSFV
ncbi:MAG: twin-arginine translocation pathway signal [Bacteroidetes bacterium]|nr:MAG: twin-arginine translocation pathway signal [Bacteroidota bacterium]